MAPLIELTDEEMNASQKPNKLIELTDAEMESASAPNKLIELTDEEMAAPHFNYTPIEPAATPLPTNYADVVKSAAADLPVATSQLGAGIIGFGSDVAQGTAKAGQALTQQIIQNIVPNMQNQQVNNNAEAMRQDTDIAANTIKGMFENAAANTQQYYTGQRPEETYTNVPVKSELLPDDYAARVAKGAGTPVEQPPVFSNIPGGRELVQGAKAIPEFIGQSAAELGGIAGGLSAGDPDVIRAVVEKPFSTVGIPAVGVVTGPKMAIEAKRKFGGKTNAINKQPDIIEQAPLYNRTKIAENTLKIGGEEIEKISDRYASPLMRKIQAIVQDKRGPVYGSINRTIAELEKKMKGATTPAEKATLQADLEQARKEKITVQKRIADQDYLASFISAFQEDFKDSIRPLDENGINMTALGSYLEAKRITGEIANKPDIAQNLDPKTFIENEDFIRRVESMPDYHSKLEAARQKLSQSWEKNVLTPLKEAEIIDENIYNVFKGNDSYTPFEDVGHMLDKKVELGDTDYNSPEIKRLVGSDKLRRNPVLSFLERGEQLINFAKTIKAKNDFVNFVNQYDPGIMRNGEKIQEITPGTAKQFDITTWKNGEKQYWKVTDPTVRTALKDPKMLHRYINAIPGARAMLDFIDPVLQATAITFNLPFTLYRNPLMDIGSAATVGPVDAGKLVKNLPGGFVEGVKASIGKSGDLTKELLHEGAILPTEHTAMGRDTASLHTITSRKLKAEFSKFFETHPTISESILNGIDKFTGVFEIPMKSFENTTKLSAAKALLETKGVKSIAELRSKYGEAAASQMIEDIRDTGSPRFPRSGHIAPLAKYFSKFLPAAIQGEFTDIENVYRTMKERPARFALIVLPAITLSMAQIAKYNGWLGKEERDKMLKAGVTDRTLQTSWAFDLGNGKVWRYPKPRWINYFDRLFLNGDPDKMKQSWINLATGMIKNGLLNTAASIPDESAQYKTAEMWASYLAESKAAPKSYTGQSIMSENQWAAHNDETVKGLLKQTWNEWFGSLYRMEPDAARDILSKEKNKNKKEIPLLSPLRRAIVRLPEDSPSNMGVENIYKEVEQEKANVNNQAEVLGAKMAVARTQEEKKAIQDEFRKTLLALPPDQRLKMKDDFLFNVKKAKTNLNSNNKSGIVKVLSSIPTKSIPMYQRIYEKRGISKEEFNKMLKEAKEKR